MKEARHNIGMVGLGVMGRNLLLNMAENGYAVAGYDKDEEKVRALDEESGNRQVFATVHLKEFITSLAAPRVVMMLVPAGDAVDSVIHDLLPYLDKDDTIIDGGNSHFSDTELRIDAMAEKGIRYLGIGISGGASGARHGPSMMPGGDRQSYESVQEIFEAASAHVESDPCVAYLGPRSAGHYVKMVHNGIEYGLMQLIAETYDVMKRGMSMNDDEIHAAFKEWSQGELASYLIEITADIFVKEDDRTGRRLIDVILDEAKQKGTGMWTSQEGMDAAVPLPTIDTAVTMRHLSALDKVRTEASRVFGEPDRHTGEPRDEALSRLRDALYLSFVVTYSQGMDLLSHSSQTRHFNLNLETIARIWRGGCIIRAKLLDDIRSAYHHNPDETSLLFAPHFSDVVTSREKSLRTVVRTAIDRRIPAPALSATLSYLDALRSGWLPANLIQAQRDYFGSHTYERVDARGTFHTRWEKE